MAAAADAPQELKDAIETALLTSITSQDLPVPPLDLPAIVEATLAPLYGSLMQMGWCDDVSESPTLIALGDEDSMDPTLAYNPVYCVRPDLLEEE